jgi:two-component system LytT family sensor kinase
MTLGHSRVRWYLGLFAAFTAIGLFFTVHMYLGDWPHTVQSFHHHLLDEMTGAWSAMLLVPPLVAVARRFRFRTGAVARTLWINAAALTAYTLLHTTIETAMRAIFGPLLGVHESYNLAIVYSQEAAGDVVYYSLIMTSIYLLVRFMETRDLETQLAQAQLENLRLQLQPHFLFNTLNAISSVMYDDPAKADRMLAQVSEYMRRVLASSGVQQIPLDEELSMERMYVEIMQTRLERGLSLDVRVDERARTALVPFMLLQPLLENSIRHGMGSGRERLALEIGIACADGSMTIEVADDGIGYAPSGRVGIGLSNVRERLERLYGARAAFAIGARDGGGTRAVISLPLHAGRTS